MTDRADVVVGIDGSASMVSRPGDGKLGARRWRRTRQHVNPNRLSNGGGRRGQGYWRGLRTGIVFVRSRGLLKVGPIQPSQRLGRHRVATCRRRPDDPSSVRQLRSNFTCWRRATRRAFDGDRVIGVRDERAHARHRRWGHKATARRHAASFAELARLALRVGGGGGLVKFRFTRATTSRSPWRSRPGPHGRAAVVTSTALAAGGGTWSEADSRREHSTRSLRIATTAHASRSAT